MLVVFDHGVDRLRIAFVCKTFIQPRYSELPDLPMTQFRPKVRIPKPQLIDKTKHASCYDKLEVVHNELLLV